MKTSQLMAKACLLLAGLAFIAIFAYQKWLQPPFYHAQSYVFGTLVEISIAGENAEKARELTNHIFKDFQSLHQRLHAWKPISATEVSELQSLNQAFKTSNHAIKIAPDIAQILQQTKQLSVQSQELFNPAIGHLIHYWGFQRDEFSAINIDPAAIKNLVDAAPKMTDIIIQGNQIHSNNRAVNLDVGGYAKGYALDLAVQYLKSQQVKNALINIGGNIIALGQHGTKPWRVGILHPRKPEALASVDLLDGWAIGTSGDYQRYFALNGRRYCHLIDPRTGYPVQHTQAVSVLIPPQAQNKTAAGVLSDVASKPIFIEDLPNKAKMAKKMGVDYFLVIDQRGNINVSKALVNKLHWLESNIKFNTYE